MIVFHGSDVIVDKPKILSVTRPLDFGSGFYVTTNRDQALSWAKRVSYRNNTKFAYLNSYDFQFESAKGNMRIIKFDGAGEKWLDFICKNRRMAYTGDDYDIVIGPVADDKVYRVVINYENGEIDKDEALKRLKVEKLCDQILFHDFEALKYLKFINAEVCYGEK